MTDTLDPIRRAELAAWAERARRPGESLLDAIRREIIAQVIADSPRQVDAARTLGVSPRVLNYELGKTEERPVDLARRARLRAVAR